LYYPSLQYKKRHLEQEEETTFTDYNLDTNNKYQDNNEEEENILNSSDTVDLSRSLENAQISRKSYKTPTRKEACRSVVQGCSSTGCPYLLYTWKDKKCNKIVNIEVLMYREVNDQYIKVDLVKAGNNCQILVVAQPLPASWPSIDHFESLYEEETLNWGDVWTDHIKEPQDKHGNFISKQEFELPFHCDDYSLKGAYERTGVWYDYWAIKKAAKRCSSVLKTVGYVNVLNTQLVAEKKLKEEKAKTPKTRSKKVAYIQAVPHDDYDDSDDSDDDIDDDISFNLDTSMHSKNGKQATDINIGKSFESCQE
jgi:hypothetical protein